MSSPAVRCDAQKEDAITVIIARDGTVYFRNYRTTFDDLPRAIEEAVRDGAERKVYVKADARARYSDVEATIDAIRLAGIREAVFLLRGVEQPTFRVATQ